MGLSVEQSENKRVISGRKPGGCLGFVSNALLMCSYQSNMWLSPSDSPVKIQKRGWGWGGGVSRATFFHLRTPWQPISINCTLYINKTRPASWSSGQGLWLLIMRSRVRFPVLPWEFFPCRERFPWWPWSGQLVDLGLRPLLVFHLPTYHSHHRDNVVAPCGRPNLRSRLHYRHNQEGNHESS